MNEQMSKRTEIEYGSYLAWMCLVALSVLLLYFRCVFSIYFWHCEQFLYYTEPSVCFIQNEWERAHKQKILSSVYIDGLSLSSDVCIVLCANKMCKWRQEKKNRIKDNVQVARPFLTVSLILLLRTTNQNTHHKSVERLHATAKQQQQWQNDNYKNIHLGN